MYHQKSTLMHKILLLLFINGFINHVTSTIPIVFPNLNTNDILILNEKEQTLTITDGAFPNFICINNGENPEFEEAKKECQNDIIIITNKDSIEINAVQLTDDGILQPILEIPSIKISNQDLVVNQKKYGVKGYETDVDSDIEVTSESTFDEEDLIEEEDLNTDTDDSSSIGSSPSPENNETSANSDEETLARLENSIEDAESNDTKENIEYLFENPSILNVNETDPFLTEDGYIIDNTVMLVENIISNLEPFTLLQIQFIFDDNITRNVTIYYDSDFDVLDVTPLTSMDDIATENKTNTDISFLVEISLFTLISNDDNKCNAFDSYLDKFSKSALLNKDNQPGAADLEAIRTGLDKLTVESEESYCKFNLLEENPEDLVKVSGGKEQAITTSNVTYSSEYLDTNEGLVVQVDVIVEVDIGKRTEVVIELIPVSTYSTNSGTEMTYQIELMDENMKESTKTADNVGEASSRVVTVTVSATLATSISSSVIISGTGAGLSTGITTSTVSTGTFSNAMNMLALGQGIFIISKLQISDFPENYNSFANKFSWTMYDSPLPWENNNSDNEDNNDLVIIREKASPLDTFKRIFFYQILIFFLVIILHISASALVLFFRMSYPSILRFPRLEIMYLFFAMPSIAAGSAALLKSKEEWELALGISLLIIFPFTFIIWNLIVIYHAFFESKPEEWKACFELKSNIDIGDDKSQNLEKKHNLFEYVLTPLLGPPYVEAMWKSTRGPENRFMTRFGPIFEDNRGFLVHRSNASYNCDRNNKKVDRGQIKLRKIQRQCTCDIGSVIRLTGKVLSLMKAVFIACYLYGEDETDSLIQAYILIGLTTAYILVLRIFRPHITRWDLSLEILNEFSSLLAYILAAVIITNNDSKEALFRERLGDAMLVFKGVVLFFYLLGSFLILIDFTSKMVIAVKHYFKSAPKVLDVIKLSLIKNQSYLERKYFNIWMRNTIGKGLYVGPLTRDKNAPFEESVYVNPKSILNRLMCKNRIKN